MRSAPLTDSIVFLPAGTAVASAASPSRLCGTALSCACTANADRATHSWQRQICDLGTTKGGAGSTC